MAKIHAQSRTVSMASASSRIVKSRCNAPEEAVCLKDVRMQPAAVAIVFSITLTLPPVQAADVSSST